ncbi:MAG: glutamine amidotransferase [Treponema sp.]|nr:glutamine amidotransferase [Treponema sp.]
MTKKVLLAGESWMSYTTHVKGFDAFYTSTYETGEKWLKAALEKGGYEVDFMPNHLVSEHFPFTVEELSKYRLVILSDVGSNTLLLPHATFARSETRPNRCATIRDYVLAGGGLIMVGGYLTFSGVDAKGRWGATPVQEVLPVKISDVDDRREHCEGIVPVAVKAHRALAEVKGPWPALLGYNRTEPLPGADVVMTIGGDPFIAFSSHGRGKSAVFTSDCSPHWAPPPFVNWEYYDKLWQGIAGCLTE